MSEEGKGSHQQRRNAMKSKGIINRTASQGLYANIAAKRERIANGSGERMRQPGDKGAPTEKAFRDSAKTPKRG
jgi:hypothetical protein